MRGPITEPGKGTAVAIRDITTEDQADWRLLWDGYLKFYEASIPDAVTAATWARILDPARPILGRVAERRGRAVGFTHSILHAGTWSVAPVCYLEDLYVDPALRGSGIGRALIDDLIAMGRSAGWACLYWVTRAGNVTARQLYDRFCPADDFVRYRLPLSG